MREIKFRAYIKKERKFIYDISNINLMDNSIEIVLPNNKNLKYDKNEIILDQAIGLLDMKRCDIYEGDIVEFTAGAKVGFLDNKGEIVYDKKTASYTIQVSKSYSKYNYLIAPDYCFKIIGNKYGVK